MSLTPNGIESLSDRQIHAKAVVAARAQSSYHLIGSSGPGDHFDVLSNDRMGVARLRLRGATGEIRTIGGDVWTRGSDEFYREAFGSTNGEMMANLRADAWLHLEYTDPRFEDDVTFRDITFFIKARGELSKGEKVDVDGVPTIVVHDDEGPTMYVSTVGEPLPIRLETPEGDAQFDVTYGDPVHVEPPPASETVEVPTD